MTYYFNYTTQFTNEWLLSRLVKLYNETNNCGKSALICRLTPCYNSEFYTILKIHNEAMAEHYLTSWYENYKIDEDKMENVFEEETNDIPETEEVEKQRKIKEQEADEIRVKYVIAVAGVVLFIVLLIAILCVQNC